MYNEFDDIMSDDTDVIICGEEPFGEFVPQIIEDSEDIDFIPEEDLRCLNDDLSPYLGVM